MYKLWVPGVSSLELCRRLAGQHARGCHPREPRPLCVGRAGLRLWPGGPLLWADVPDGPAAEGRPGEGLLPFVSGA